jgi:hypothetical protein
MTVPENKSERVDRQGISVECGSAMLVDHAEKIAGMLLP